MPVINPLPNNILNGDALDATAVMANFNQILNNVNTNAAALSTQNTFAQPQNGVAAILPAQFTILSQVQALIAAAVPIGTLLDFGGPTAPSGYYLCDGSAKSRTTDAALFAVIGTAWGAGDGVTTFNVPDFRRASSIGSGGTGTGVVGSATGAAGGAETHVMTVAELVQHSHGITDPGHAHSISDPGHTHTLNDPGHSHSVNDPGHAHGYASPNASDVVAAGANYFGAGVQANTTNGSGTGISLYAALTGTYLSAAGTNVSIFGAFTSITVNNQGSSAASSLYHPVRVVTKIIRNGQ